MSRIEVLRQIKAPRETVWQKLADLASHAEWMADADEIEFLSDQTAGVGTIMRVPTSVGPLRTTDLIEVTGWDDGRSIEVEHTGLIRGRGALSVTPRGVTTLVTWAEELEFPWWLGGPLTALIARPVMSAIWRRNLERLEASLNLP